MWLWLLGCGGSGDACAPSGDAPASVADVLARIAALGAAGEPVTLECFVTSLPRPLPVEASAEIFSAQPAYGDASPRLLLWFPGITLTVATEGPGAEMLEIGEITDDGRSIKAEVPFPVIAPLADDAPFAHLLAATGEGTGCGVCHSDEVEVAPGVYASDPFRTPEELLVPLDAVAAEARACGASDRDRRCATLRAVFEAGDVEHTPLPSDWPTIYGAR